MSEHDKKDKYFNCVKKRGSMFVAIHNVKLNFLTVCWVWEEAQLNVRGNHDALPEGHRAPQDTMIDE
jgi:hypothetical protein